MAIIFDEPGAHFIFGTNQQDTIFGLDGNDTISGLLDPDVIDGGTGVDTVDYLYSDDGFRIDLFTDAATNLLTGSDETIRSIENVNGSRGNDRIFGDNGANLLRGEAGRDLIHGEGGNDVLEGGIGNDTLVGEGGNDRLVGGAGMDSLQGGGGSDQFVYRTASEATGDRINGFDGAGIQLAGSVEDRIVLSEIDANSTLRGNQAFEFLGELTDALGRVQGPGSLWVHDDPLTSMTYLHGNTDGDTGIELTILIADGGGTTANDYWGGDFFL